jgi:hypothetical protein
VLLVQGIDNFSPKMVEGRNMPGMFGNTYLPAQLIGDGEGCLGWFVCKITPGDTQNYQKNHQGGDKASEVHHTSQ